LNFFPSYSLSCCIEYSSIGSDIKSTSYPLDLSALPPRVDWREHGIITAVKDQGQCGSCWTFGTAETIESYWANKTGELTDLSEQQILDCTSNPNQCGGTGGCGGGTAEVAFESIITAGGLADEWTYPYVSYYGNPSTCALNATTQPRPVAFAQISSYTTLPPNQYNPVFAHIAKVGPLAISVDASLWSPYEEGIFNGCNQTDPDIDHEVQLVGYGIDNQLGEYWLVRNSWSPFWGEEGYIRIQRSSTVTCGTDTQPSDGTGCKNGPSSVTVCGTCGILYDSTYPTVVTKK